MLVLVNQDWVDLPDKYDIAAIKIQMQTSKNCQFKHFTAVLFHMQVHPNDRVGMRATPFVLTVLFRKSAWVCNRLNSHCISASVL